MSVRYMSVHYAIRALVCPIPALIYNGAKFIKIVAYVPDEQPFPKPGSTSVT